MIELRIRACHITGHFACKDNRPPQFSRNHVLENPDFDYSRICLPPSTYAQEKHKIEFRMPTAVRYIRDQALNEVFDGHLDDIGIITQGGMFNAVMRSLAELGLADHYGRTDVPIYVLNVTYPLINDEITGFCAGKKAVLIVEEGQPDYLEQALNAILRKADLNTGIVGKDVLPMAGEYTGEVVLTGIAQFIEGSVPRGVDLGRAGSALAAMAAPKKKAAETLGESVPARPPGFCVGCPERPVFSAMKLVEREIGPVHMAADIGCHLFSTLPPFNMGNTVLGYGLGLASAAGLAPAMKRRVVSVMGDGGFWHNGLATSVASALYNKDDSVLVIFDNNYSAATGGQHVPSSGTNAKGEPTGMDIEAALKGLGVKWLRTLSSYGVATMVKALKEALTTTEGGLKVIVADGECQLAVQRRIRPRNRKKLAAGERLVRTRYGIDDDVCTGDHACIRLSGCPSLTLKPNPDPLRTDPIATVNNECVGCGLCGEVADAAALCPSFYRADIIQNPTLWDRFVHGLRRRAISWLQTGEAYEAHTA